MKKRLWILAAAALAAGLAAGCAKAPDKAAGRKKDRGPVPVRTAFVAQRDVSETLLFTGELEAPLAVEVKPKIPGRLEKMELADGRPTTEGVAVRQGEVIATLDDRELKAQAALAKAQAEQAEVTVAERERERKRLEALYAQAVATEQARDTAVSAHEGARAALAQAQAQLQLAQVNLAEATIRAPMDGVVAARYADPGAMVGPAAAIVQIVQMDPLRLMLAVPARLLPLLTEGQTQVAVETDVRPGREMECTLARIFPAADPETRTVRAEVLLPNPPEDGAARLRPGMYATAKLTVAARPGALTVPAAAIVRVLDRQLVFTVQDGVAHAADVQTGIRDGADIEIVSGLAAGDEYVTLGQNKLTDGAPIERVAPAPAE